MLNEPAEAQHCGSAELANSTNQPLSSKAGGGIQVGSSLWATRGHCGHTWQLFGEETSERWRISWYIVCMLFLMKAQLWQKECGWCFTVAQQNMNCTKRYQKRFRRFSFCQSKYKENKVSNLEHLSYSFLQLVGLRHVWVGDGHVWLHCSNASLSFCTKRGFKSEIGRRASAAGVQEDVEAIFTSHREIFLWENWKQLIF